MPRKRLIRQNDFPYHVTTRTNNKDWFRIPLNDVFKLFKDSLVYAQEKHPVNVHCFVLMSNHYHLLISTPNSDIDKFMMHFNLKLSRLIEKRSGYINHKFSNRYKWSIVQNCNYLYNVYRYIYQNPIRANLSKRCIDYKYSSLRIEHNEKELLNIKEHLEYKYNSTWFETIHGDEFDSILRYGLKKTIFRPRNSISRHYSNVLNSR